MDRPRQGLLSRWRVSADTTGTRNIALRFFKLCFLLTSMTDSAPTSRFGFVAFAETWNGRLAMLGFVIGLATELLTGKGILGQIGLG